MRVRVPSPWPSGLEKKFPTPLYKCRWIWYNVHREVKQETSRTLFDNLVLCRKDLLSHSWDCIRSQVSPWRKPVPGNLGSNANGFSISMVQSTNGGHVSQLVRYASYKVRRAVWHKVKPWSNDIWNGRVCWLDINFKIAGRCIGCIPGSYPGDGWVRLPLPLYQLQPQTHGSSQQIWGDYFV